MDCFLGIDLGSSSVKVSVMDGENGRMVAKSFAPESEAPILSVQNGWAEQNPDDWWTYLKTALRQAMASGAVKAEDIKAVGITYQMHGLGCSVLSYRVLASISTMPCPLRCAFLIPNRTHRRFLNSSMKHNP